VEKAPVVLADFAEGLFETHRYAPDARQIDFQTKLEAGLVLNTDASRLQVVLNNMVANAVRYHNPYQTEAFIRLEAYREGNEVRISVVDNGQGIDPKHLGRIFDMFYRANKHKSGSGLGLYIVKETLDKLGGTIEVASELNKGTTFTIRLPHG
jgi:signal transduction histidine kinase